MAIWANFNRRRKRNEEEDVNRNEFDVNNFNIKSADETFHCDVSMWTVTLEPSNVD